MKCEDVISRLKELGQPEVVERKEQKFGVVAHRALGIYQKELNAMAKEIGKDSSLALQLFETGIYEARVLCSKTFRSKDLTMELVSQWTPTFENWEICDSFSMILYAKSKLAQDIIHTYIHREKEFEKRAGYATLAAYCMADKKADNSIFEGYLPLIKGAATDNRLYVKKAVNWGLRSIGKRNQDLRRRAIDTAYELLNLNSPSATWIAKDAIKELENSNCRISDYPRHIYRIQ